jgi:hypothetical protein
MWTLLRWSTPPVTSGAFDWSERSRLIVVSLLPNAAKNSQRELVGIEQFGSEPGYGFFDLDDVHDVSCA